MGGGSALDVAAETHVDRQCGEETLLTFVYKCADAVRSAEGVLKPHCQPMQMPGTTRGGRGGYIQYLLCVLLFPPSSSSSSPPSLALPFFLFCCNDFHVWPHIERWNYFSAPNGTVLFKGI